MAFLTRLLVVGLLVLLAAPAARGDVVHLHGGRQLVGRVTESGDLVTVEVNGGSLTLPRSRIERIERALLPAERARQLAANVDRSDGVAVADAADEATAAGLPELAAELWTAALAAAPEDAALRGRHRAWHIDDRVPPEDDDAAAALVAALGGPVGAQHGKLLRTRHWRVAYSHAATDSVRLRASMLEATWREFHAFAETVGVVPRLIEDRLEALVFADHRRWAAATGLAPEALVGLDGLYVGHTGRMLLYENSTAPELRLALHEVDERLAELEELLGSPEAAADPEWRSRIEASRTKIADHRRELVERSRQATLSTATHEACHQLAFATGLCRGDQPIWLLEGIATLFEPTERERFLVTAPNAGRLRDVREAWAAGRGGDLRRIVAGGTFENAARHGDVSSTAVAYAEAWSLVHYLMMRHREAFALYLKLPGTGRGDAGDRTSLFMAAFGDDLDALQRGWHRHVDRL